MIPVRGSLEAKGTSLMMMRKKTWSEARMFWHPSGIHWAAAVILNFFPIRFSHDSYHQTFFF